MFCDQPSNRGTFFQAHDKNRSNTTTLIPHLPLVPVATGLKIIQHPATPWKLKRLLTISAEQKSEEVQNLLKPAITWVTHAVLQGKNGEESKLCRDLGLIIRPFKSLLQCLWVQLFETIDFGAK
mmetsp:Transcript_7564/g.16383  ORF Transcript_7564/g.16383 Transcript_7564/m.16383 type:complete len:124 (+) Transcript_7564:39-410(+)